ncbi:hypothetical protein [Permianibacter aggregans]|uniref:Uncharacterized protein n=1 Tax=Permianibacter aggregans TaxID=1510150 RepID=A0A4R6UJR9_9GAMM|nr:hypothetical protein [Permianibacter aggregans]QGX38449.1 hypothetical protein E2H98_01705 [Permianibacter aggregans]TDQ45563.1 hypothetical protein EV696_11931 [Permianibacter aggregans]
MPEIANTNLSVSNALVVSQAAENRNTERTRANNAERQQRTEQVEQAQRDASPAALEEAFNSLQAEREGQVRNALESEAANSQRSGANAYQQTENFLQRDQLTRLVGFDDFA